MVSEVNGETRLIVEVFAIREASPKSLRYDSAITDDQRRDLRNLLLLCDQHRGEVDANAVERLEETDSEAAKLMRSLLDELTESYVRQRGALDPAINDFYMATRQLGRMQDVLEEFVVAVHLSVNWRPLSDQGDRATGRRYVNSRMRPSKCSHPGQSAKSGR